MEEGWKGACTLKGIHAFPCYIYVPYETSSAGRFQVVELSL